MKNFTLLLVFLVLGKLLNAQSCMQTPVSIESRIQNSNLIVEGVVIDQFAKWNANQSMIYTYNEIVPLTVYKGSEQKSILIRTKGGQIDDQKIVVEPSLNLNVKNQGVFFLKPTEEPNVFETYAVNQGAVLYDISSNKATSVFDSYSLSSKELNQKIVSITNIQPKENLNPSKDLLKNISSNNNARTTQVTITGLSTTVVDAGMNDLLTIYGSGFGLEKGAQRVEFRSADSGGKSVYRTNAGYVSWADDKIEVYVPHKAGSGVVSFFNGTETVATSTESLTINFSRKNATYGGNFIPIQLVDRNGLGGYSISVHESFKNNTDAYALLNEAVSKWSVLSGINWELSSTPVASDNTTTNRDKINNMYFVPQSEIGAGVLGATVSHMSGCRNSDGTITFYLDEFDMYYNQDMNWNFTNELPQSNQFDFLTVILHELGHSHQLGHVINPASVMHYSASRGYAKRELTEFEESGSKELVEMSSQADFVCNTYAGMIPATTLPVSNLEVESCSNIYQYGGIIKQNEWHKITNENYEQVLHFNPQGNDIDDMRVNIYLEMNPLTGLEEAQLEIDALDANGNIVAITEPMDIRLIYPKAQIDNILSEFNIDSISELDFVKNNANCGEGFNPELELERLSIVDTNLGGEDSYILETRVSGFSSFFAKALDNALMPVTWADFTATANEFDQVDLNWSTLTESNSSHFEVTSSVDGYNWVTIGNVTASNFSTELKEYSFQDVTPAAGRNYYRLVQVDTDGAQDYSDIVIANVEANNSAKNIVYANGMLEIMAPAEVSIYSINGHLVLNKETTNNETINLSHLTKGMYIVTSTMGNSNEVSKVAIH